MASASMGSCGKSDADNDRSNRTSSPKASNASTARTGIEVPAGLSPAERSAAELARDALIRACGITEEKWGLFSRTKLEVRQALGYRQDKFDWHTAVWITLVCKDELEPGIGGHHLPFYLGAGKRPGIVTSKRQAIEFCGLAGRARGVVSGKPCSSDGSEDCILELEELKALDADRPPDIVSEEGQKAVQVQVYCFGYGFDPPELWTCSRTARECRDARKAEKREEQDDYRVRTKCNASDEAHCFVVNGKNRTRCAPNAETCIRARKGWTDLGNEVEPCRAATTDLIQASLEKDD